VSSLHTALVEDKEGNRPGVTSLVGWGQHSADALLHLFIYSCLLVSSQAGFRRVFRSSASNFCERGGRFLFAPRPRGRVSARVTHRMSRPVICVACRSDGWVSPPPSRVRLRFYDGGFSECRLARMPGDKKKKGGGPLSRGGFGLFWEDGGEADSRSHRKVHGIRFVYGPTTPVRGDDAGPGSRLLRPVRVRSDRSDEADLGRSRKERTCQA